MQISVGEENESTSVSAKVRAGLVARVLSLIQARTYNEMA